jgi:signal transduction histidine kinase
MYVILAICRGEVAGMKMRDDDKIVNSMLGLPIAFAVWKAEAECVLLSESLSRILSINSNIASVTDFANAVENTFGDFLYTASKHTLFNNEYDRVFGQMHLTLRYNKACDVYTFITATKESSDFLENVIDSLPIFVWARNKDLKIQYCNKRYADVLETTKQAVIEGNMKLPITTPQAWPSIEQLALSSLKPQASRKHVIINGSRRFLEFTELPTKIGYAIDISEEERITKEYDIYRKQMIEVFNHISVPIATFDVNTNLVFANNVMLRLFDFDESYLASTPNISEILDDLMDKRKIMEMDDFSTFKQKISGYFRDIVSPYYTFMHTPDGRALNVIISPNYGGGLTFVFEDTTEKINMEREYKSLAIVQKETLDHLYEGIVVFGSDNRLKMTNPAINKLWDKTEEKRRDGIHIKDFFMDSADLFKKSEDAKSWIAEVINMSSSRIENLGSFKFKSGKIIEYVYVPLPGGLNLLRFVDITDKTKLERAMTERSELISQIDKLKSSFIANISYELKAPINTISGFTDILANQYFGPLNEQQLKYCHGITIAIKKLSETIEAMLNLVNIEAGQMRMLYKEIYVSALLRNIVNLFSKTLKDRLITVSFVINDDDMTIYADEKSLKQCIYQIISKILQFTKREEEITISVTSTEDPNCIDVKVKNTSHNIISEELSRLRMVMGNLETDEKSYFTAEDFNFAFASKVIKLHNGETYINSGTKLKPFGTEIGFRIPKKPTLNKITINDNPIIECPK